MEFSVADKKQLKEQIDKNFSRDEFIEIFKIIRDDKAKYTENRNGIHVVFSLLSNETLTKIKQFVDFSIENKNKLEEHERIYNDERLKIESNKCNQEEVVNNFPVAVTNEYNDHLENSIFDKEECEDTDFSEDEDVAENVAIKPKKQKFTGIKAKILKNYKSNITPAVTTKKTGVKKEEEVAVAEC